MTYGQAKTYQDELEEEIKNVLRQEIVLYMGHRKWIVPKKISHSDPENGYYVKGEREKQLAYSAHTFYEDNDLIYANHIRKCVRQLSHNESG